MMLIVLWFPTLSSSSRIISRRTRTSGISSKRTASSAGIAVTVLPIRLTCFLALQLISHQQTLGLPYTLTDSDYGLDSSMKAMNLFNSIVNGLCNTPLRACCTYAVPAT
ncbi:hypothetical protein COOONC_26845, partial [Cooperia oncophora]